MDVKAQLSTVLLPSTMHLGTDLGQACEASAFSFCASTLAHKSNIQKVYIKRKTIVVLSLRPNTLEKPLGLFLPLCCGLKCLADRS